MPFADLTKMIAIDGKNNRIGKEPGIFRRSRPASTPGDSYGHCASRVFEILPHPHEFSQQLDRRFAILQRDIHLPWGSHSRQQERRSVF
jgi:hypothetical protein